MLTLHFIWMITGSYYNQEAALFEETRLKLICTCVTFNSFCFTATFPRMIKYNAIQC